MDPSSFLKSLADTTRERFVREKRVLSFKEYMALFMTFPWRLGRNAPQFVKDTLDYYGKSVVKRPTIEATHFNLFDAPFSGGKERLIGQEEVQEGFYQTISELVREGKTSQLILLHGPNGSAKTSFVQCLARAMVDYSKTDEGALYTFNWIFPKSSYLGKKVGFKSSSVGENAETFAFLDDQEIAAVVPAELHEHPLFLLRKEDRQSLFDSLAAEGRLPPDFRFSDHLVQGDLGPVSRRIYDSLLASYHGDVSRVLAHVQVCRFLLSRRYRRGIVTIEPQLHVDASARQVTIDESYANLPAVLRHIPMFEFSGDLVHANRGLLEFSDIFKRPIDTFKYLLGTCEHGKVTVDGTILYLDIVIIGSTNDKYLDAFTKTPEFPAFKGRMKLIRVPYIRDYLVEKQIYDMQVTPEVVGKHIAPHSTYVAALWAVLTRMRKCDPSMYPDSIKNVVEKLTPLQKADLYALGTAPASLRTKLAQQLQHEITTIFNESNSLPGYEGSFGASPREIKDLLLSAAHDSDLPCLHPVRIFDRIRELIKQRSLYEFLQIPPSGEFYAANILLERVIERYTEKVESEFKQAMGMVTDEEFERLLQRYAIHASAWLKKESVLDPITRDLVPPDQSFLEEMEHRWGSGEKPETTRQDFIGRIASFSLDHPGESPPYRVLFADYFERLRQSYYAENKSEMERTIRIVRDHLDGAKLPPDELSIATNVIENLISKFNYCPGCISPTLSFLAHKMAAQQERAVSR